MINRHFLFFIPLILILTSCKTDPELSDIQAENTIDYAKLGMEEPPNGEYKGLEVGMDAPDFAGIDQFGNEYDLESLTKDSTLVLIFYRGQWCGICNRYLSKFAKEMDTLTQLGARVVAVSPELQENVEKTIQNTGLKIPIISDLDRSIMDAFGVSFKVTPDYDVKIKDKLNTDIAMNNGNEEAWLPVPATYIIGQDKKIKYVHFDPNYKVRPSIPNIARNLK